MAKCIRCDGEMCSFTLAERGRCNCCGFDVEDMAEILNELLATLKAIIRESDPYTATKGWPTPDLFANWVIEQSVIAIAKAKGEGNDTA